MVYQYKVGVWAGDRAASTYVDLVPDDQVNQ